MTAAYPSATRLTMIGPMPPPIHGQSVVMSHMVSELAPHFPRMRVADTRRGDTAGLLGLLATARRTATSWWSLRDTDAVYIAVKAGNGMWLTSAAAGLARWAGVRVFLHHHSYAYVRQRQRRMRALTRAAGPCAHHIVLSAAMAQDLRRVMPEIHRLLVVGNAGLIDRELLDLPLKADSSDLVIGHLSNLSAQKGLGEVVDLAIALRKAGVRARLIIGGPAVDDEASDHLDRAANALGELFDYRGSLTGVDKRLFFDEITHFAFPSRYVHEAVPLVLYEALAAGAVCVTTRQGSIPEQLEGSPCLVASSADSLVEELLPDLVATAVSAAASRECRQAYLRALSDSERQLVDLVNVIAGRPPASAR